MIVGRVRRPSSPIVQSDRDPLWRWPSVSAIATLAARRSLERRHARLCVSFPLTLLFLRPPDL